MILHKEEWKNELENRRMVAIDLINRLFKMAGENNKGEIRIRYEHIINYLGGADEQRCFYCGHSILQHDFCHSSECRAGKCDCNKFIYETRQCELCDKIADRNEMSELMLNPHIQLIPLCKEHFRYEVK